MGNIRNRFESLSLYDNDKMENFKTIKFFNWAEHFLKDVNEEKMEIVTNTCSYCEETFSKRTYSFELE